MGKAVVISAMHGRQETVRYCLGKMPFIDKIMIYTTDEDGAFLDTTDVIAKAQVRNNPLSYKWHQAIRCLKQVDFDYCILLGSDDYIDEKFLKFVDEEIKDCDMIGFLDAYYEANGKNYYWTGYQNHREGEPVGAGKVYSKDFLERIDYMLFPGYNDVGLDAMSWKVVQGAGANVKKFKLIDHDIRMTDVKDGKGMNSIEKLINTLDGFREV